MPIHYPKHYINALISPLHHTLLFISAAKATVWMSGTNRKATTFKHIEWVMMTVSKYEDLGGCICHKLKKEVLMQCILEWLFYPHQKQMASRHKRSYFRWSTCTHERKRGVGCNCTVDGSVTEHREPETMVAVQNHHNEYTGHNAWFSGMGWGTI